MEHYTTLMQVISQMEHELDLILPEESTPVRLRWLLLKLMQLADRVDTHVVEVSGENRT